MSTQVAVVTVNWNGWRDTLECVAALRRTDGASWRLFIVDNASTDESMERLSGLGDEVVLIRSPRNGGWTGGNNLGVAEALSEGFDYVFVLNNDALVEPDTLEALVAADASRPGGRRAVLGGQVRTVDNRPADVAQNRMDPVTGLPMWSPLDSGPAAERSLAPTAVVHGAALFAHRSVFEAVGPFDDDFYLYFDETEWCYRAARAGYASWIVPWAVVRHTGGASMGGEHSPLFRYFNVRNQLLLAEKYSTWRQRLQVAKIPYRELRHIAGSSGRGAGPLAMLFGRHPELRAVRRGVLDYVRRRFGDCPPMVRRLNARWLELGAA